MQSKDASEAEKEAAVALIADAGAEVDDADGGFAHEAERAAEAWLGGDGFIPCLADLGAGEEVEAAEDGEGIAGDGA